MGLGTAPSGALLLFPFLKTCRPQMGVLPNPIPQWSTPSPGGAEPQPTCVIREPRVRNKPLLSLPLRLGVVITV